MIKIIKVFIASSIDEFKEIRKETASFFLKLNNILIDSDVFIQFVQCEEMDSDISKTRKQDEYNRFIKECDFVIFLFGEKLGDYTSEELDVAIQSFQDRNHPNIFMFFKEELNNPKSNALKNRVCEEDQYTTISGIEQSRIKLECLKEINNILKRDDIDIGFEIKNGYAKINGKQIKVSATCN